VEKKFICFSISFFELGKELFALLQMQLNFEVGMATVRSTINIILFGVPRYEGSDRSLINPLNVELNPICNLLALLGAHHILHVSKIRVNEKVFPIAEGYQSWDGSRSKCLNLLTV